MASTNAARSAIVWTSTASGPGGKVAPTGADLEGYRVGDIVLVPVPFNFEGKSKLRPAVIIHISGRNAFVCPFYTKHRPATTFVGPTPANGLGHDSHLSYRAKTIERRAIQKRLGVIDPSIGNWLLPGHWAPAGTSPHPRPVRAGQKVVALALPKSSRTTRTPAAPQGSPAPTSVPGPAAGPDRSPGGARRVVNGEWAANGFPGGDWWRYD
jgi:hypothetical protein